MDTTLIPFSPFKLKKLFYVTQKVVLRFRKKVLNSKNYFMSLKKLFYIKCFHKKVLNSKNYFMSLNFLWAQR
jgi:hypothetical protein